MEWILWTVDTIGGSMIYNPTLTGSATFFFLGGRSLLNVILLIFRMTRRMEKK